MLEPVVGVQELQIRRNLVGVYHEDFLAETFQNADHCQFAPQSIAVGANVAGQQESLVAVYKFYEFRPVGHLIIGDRG